MPAGLSRFGAEERRRLATEACRMLERLRRHGAGPDGSVSRLVYTPEWQAAMDEVALWLSEGGLEVRTDAVGSRFGRLAGELPEVVLTGSHMDSVRGGGAYDGVLGVVMAGCAVRWLAAHLGRPRRTLEVFANCEEESSRFHCNFWGSRALAGLIEPGESERLRDASGTSLAEAMSACGFDPARIPEARRSDLVAYLEPHIEQGPVLFQANQVIGVVDRIVGLRMLTVDLDGMAGHAGTIPMAHRRDALTGAAEVALGTERIARRRGAPTVATVGSLVVQPGGFNQVPGAAELTIDFRHPEEQVLDELESELRQLVAGVAASRNLTARVERRLGQRPVHFDERLCAALEAACAEAAVPWRRMPSHAGHDAQLIGTLCPAAMFFVPSRDGHSHRPDERTEPEHIGAGIEVLVRALVQIAYAEP